MAPASTAAVRGNLTATLSNNTDADATRTKNGGDIVAHQPEDRNCSRPISISPSEDTVPCENGAPNGSEEQLAAGGDGGVALAKVEKGTEGGESHSMSEMVEHLSEFILEDDDKDDDGLSGNSYGSEMINPESFNPKAKSSMVVGMYDEAPTEIEDDNDGDPSELVEYSVKVPYLSVPVRAPTLGPLPSGDSFAELAPQWEFNKNEVKGTRGLASSLKSKQSWDSHRSSSLLTQHNDSTHSDVSMLSEKSSPSLNAWQDTPNNNGHNVVSSVRQSRQMLSQQYWKSYCFLLLYILQTLASPLFLYWLLTNAWNHKSPITSALYFAAELIAWVSGSLFLFTGLFSIKEDKIDDVIEHLNANAPHVAVCLCRYKESLDDLYVTINTLLDIDYPADKLHLFILDDGFFYQSEEDQSEQMQGLSSLIPGASRLGINALTSSFQEQKVDDVFRKDSAVTSHSWKIRSLNNVKRMCPITLIARKKPQVSHYKAGNINNFLYNYCGQMASKADLPIQFMLLLDHDMIPAPNVIQEALPRFGKKDVAFVQYPQRFYDIGTNDRFYAGNEIFFDGVCQSRSHLGLTPFAGTNAVWRLEALYAIGGFQYGSITEDANTGLAAHSKGFKSVYIGKDMCVGQSPQNLPDAMKQRSRWSQGSIEILMNVVGHFFGKKRSVFPCPAPLSEKYDLAPDLSTQSIRQRVTLFLVYADSLMYPFYSFGFCFHVGVCVAYLINAQAPMTPLQPTEVLYVWLPLYIVRVFCQLSAFPMVALNVQLNAQKAWAGYSISTISSIFKAVIHSFSSRGSSWFNTGSGNKERYWLQYGNTLLFAVILFCCAYRVVAFTVLEGACEAWMTMGALIYGLTMSWLLKDWALEPFIFVDEETFDDPDPEPAVPTEISMSLSRQDSFSFVMRDSVRTKASRHRKMEEDQDSVPVSLRKPPFSFASLGRGTTDDTTRSILTTNMAQKHLRILMDKKVSYERHRPNLSVLVNFILVVMISCALFVWAGSSCDSSGGQQVVQITPPLNRIPQPPLPASVMVEADFLAVNGGLTLNGETFHLKGANWFGFETTRRIPFGLDVLPQNAVLESMAKNGINAIRLPLLVEGVLQPLKNNRPGWAVDPVLNAHLTSKNSYLDAVEAFIERTSQFGIFTLLDMHLLRADTHPDPFPFDERTPLGDVAKSWERLGERLCSHWGVMGADLKNEPYEASWGDNSTTDWKLISEELSEVVSEKCPRWLIFVEGIWRHEEENNPLTADALPTWGGMLIPAENEPIEVRNEEKLVYSPHVYGPGTVGMRSPIWAPTEFCNRLCQMCYCRQPVENLTCSFMDEDTNFLLGTETETSPLGDVSSECANVLQIDQTFPQNIPAYYDMLFGFLLDSNKTIIVGEWGGTFINEVAGGNSLISGEDPKTVRDLEAKWNDALVGYLVEREMGSFYWSINPESVDTGGLLLPGWVTDKVGNNDWVAEDGAKMSLLKRLPSTPPLPLLFPSEEEPTAVQCLKHLEIEVVVPQSGVRYEQDSLVYNKDYDGRKQPIAIVFVKSEENVSRAVRCATQSNAQVCVRSGGHSYTGDSLCAGILIDLHHLKKVLKQSESVFEVQAGNTMGELAASLLKYGRIAPAGNHHGVGTGWYLGCGRGALSRSLGLGCDYITSARLVRGTGEIVVASENEHAELLWALRGAGGHFGIVVSYSIETSPLPEDQEFASFKLGYPRDRAREVFLAWQEWAVDHSNTNFTCSYTLWGPAVEHVFLEGSLIGTLEELELILAEPLSQLGAPRQDERESYLYADFMTHVNGVPNTLQFVNPHSGWNGDRRSFHNKAHLLQPRQYLLDDEGIDTLLEHANEAVPGSLASYEGWSNYIQITPLGGAINEGRPSVFSHRFAMAIAQYGGYWEASEGKEPMVMHQRRFRAAMQSFWGNDSYMNYKDNDLLAWEEAYWGLSSVPKLGKVKCRYDPDNVFSSMKQSIICSSPTLDTELLQ